jgi:tRNA modification GTPase
LLLLDASNPKAPLPQLPREPAITVSNKADIAPAPTVPAISVRTGAGLDQLLTEIRNIVHKRLDRSEGLPLTRERYRRALSLAAEVLARSLSATAPELIGEEIRIAMRELGRITGRVDVEELLDVVFRDFCIGK